jgi:hypothetical protein
MPKRNALAPKSTNALAADYLQTLLQQSAQSPQYQELSGYLASRGMMPKFVQEPLTGRGKFEYIAGFSKDLPTEGVVSLDYYATPATSVHELTHASERQIHNQAFKLRQKSFKEKLSPLEQQFMGAYSKLMLDPSNLAANPRFELAQRIAPEWAAKKRDYRSSEKELSGFGMGSTVAPNTHYPAPPHIDPTMATEFSILLDLAAKLQGQSAAKGQ